MNKAFWKNKKVFLTGHTGFKGSWLSIWLQQLGAEVTGFSLAAPQNSMFRCADIEKDMVSHVGDIRDLSSLTKIMSDAAPEIVIHMAAQALVRESYVNPIETYSTNVMGTINVLEAVRSCKKVRSALVVTSDKCYANNEWAWGYRESDHLGGHDPYSSSKACAELAVASYRSSFFNVLDSDAQHVSVATARAGNVIGGGDWAKDRLIPDILSSIESGEMVQIRNPEAIRPWQHVLEPLSCYLTLCEHLHDESADSYAGAWNFGPLYDDAMPVKWIVEKILAKWGADQKWSFQNNNEPHEAHYLKLDCSKARDRLNVTPRWNLDDALTSIVKWHKDYLDNKNCRLTTIAQIEQFERAK